VQGPTQTLPEQGQTEALLEGKKEEVRLEGLRAKAVRFEGQTRPQKVRLEGQAATVELAGPRDAGRQVLHLQRAGPQEDRLPRLQAQGRAGLQTRRPTGGQKGVRRREKGRLQAQEPLRLAPPVLQTEPRGQRGQEKALQLLPLRVKRNNFNLKEVNMNWMERVRNRGGGQGGALQSVGLFGHFGAEREDSFEFETVEWKPVRNQQLFEDLKEESPELSSQSSRQPSESPFSQDRHLRSLGVQPRHLDSPQKAEVFSKKSEVSSLKQSEEALLGGIEEIGLDQQEVASSYRKSQKQS